MKGFQIAPFGALSAAAIEAHLGLYKGYTEQAAAVLQQLHTPAVNAAPAVLTPRETLSRRLSFESNGVVLHELFFEQLENPGGGEDKALSAALSQRFGSFYKWQDDILELGKARGPGWVVTCFRQSEPLLENIWIDLHELGHLGDSSILYVVDLWEHAYWTDYGAKGRDKYMHDLFEHSNWSVAGRRYQQALRRAA